MPKNRFAGGRGRNAFGRRWQSAFILLIIAEEPTHGYDIAQKLDDFGCLIKNTGQMGGLYRLLSDLEEDGLILADWETDKPGPAKKTYRVTQKGLDKLIEFNDLFEDLKENINCFQERIKSLKHQ